MCGVRCAFGLVGAARASASPGAARRRWYARWACATVGWPPRRFFDPRRIGRVPLPAGRHLGPVSGSACVAVGGLRRMGRRVVVEVPSCPVALRLWFAVDPMHDFSFQDADCVARCCGRQGRRLRSPICAT